MSNSDLTSITLRSQQPLEMRLIDGHMVTVARGVGSLKADLQGGIYKLELRAGFNYQEQLLELVPGVPLLREDISLPFTSTLPGASSPHAAILNELSLSKPYIPDGHAQLLFFLRPITPMASDGRDLTSPESVDFTEWWGGLFPDDGSRPGLYLELESRGDCAGTCIDAPAGSFVLHIFVPGSDSSIEFPIHLASGWQTIICLPVTNGHPRFESIQVQLLRRESPAEGYLASLDSTGNLALCREMAVTGLASGHLLVPRDQIQQMVDSMVDGKFSDPMLGILGAYSMFERLPSGKATSHRHYQLALPDTVALLDTVIGNLNRLLPGHPDIVGLRALRYQAIKGQDSPHAAPEGDDLNVLNSPTMIFMGYQALLDLDRNHDSSFQLRGLADIARVFVSACGPWTCWRGIDAKDLSLGSQLRADVQPYKDLVPGYQNEAYRDRALNFLQGVARTEGLTLNDALVRFSNDQLSEAAGISIQAVASLRTTLEQQHAKANDPLAAPATSKADQEASNERELEMGSSE